MIGICHCSHADTTHHEKRYACLGAQCDCPTYRDSEKCDDYEPKRLLPAHRSGCLCYDCTHGGRPVTP